MSHPHDPEFAPTAETTLDLGQVTIAISEHSAGPVQTVHTTLLERPGSGSLAETVADGGYSTATGQLARSARIHDLEKVGPPVAVCERRPRGSVSGYPAMAGPGRPAARATVSFRGLLTMGIGASYLTSAFGNPAWARTYAMQFAGPVPVSEQRVDTEDDHASRSPWSQSR